MTKHFNAGINDSQPSYLTHFRKKTHLKTFQSNLIQVTKGQVRSISHPQGRKLIQGTLHYYTVLHLPRYSYFSPFTQGQLTEGKTTS